MTVHESLNLLQTDVAEIGQKMTTIEEKVDRHIDEYQEYRRDEHDRMQHLMDITKSNSESIQQLTDATTNVVNAWDTAESVVHAGSVLGKFARWLGSIAVIAAAAGWVVDKFG